MISNEEENSSSIRDNVSSQVPPRGAFLAPKVRRVVKNANSKVNHKFGATSRHNPMLDTVEPKGSRGELIIFIR